MLGVLKRRWKPKSRSGDSRINTDSSLDRSLCEKGPRTVPSIRQVYPAHDDRVHSLCGGVDASPPPYPKRSSLDSNTSPPQCWRALDNDRTSPQCYPLAPNICVEGGRIRFIGHDISGTSQESVVASPPVPEARITVTRGLQTEAEKDDRFQIERKCLEQRISELETTLELAQRNEQRDRLIINKLQKQMAKRETAHQDADRERRLRIDSETRSKQAIQEANRCKSRLKLLTSEIARMEDTVKSMLVYKRQAEQFRQEKKEQAQVFENRCHHYQTSISRLNLEVESLRRQLKQVCSDPNSDILAAHTATLHRQAADSRKQYEKCLDEVANQVVKALLIQKCLREEVMGLNKKIHHLESENEALTSMLVHLLKAKSCSSGFPSGLALHDYLSSDASAIDPVLSDLAKYYNSISSKALGKDRNENIFTEADDNHPITSFNNLDARVSSEENGRYQFLTTLWKEFKSTESSTQELLEALDTLDPAVYMPPQRPVSLNLQLPIISTTKYRRSRSIHAQSNFKSGGKSIENESPESGNADEGYSTMSSDVQTDVMKGLTDGTFVFNGNIRGLEDLKEATEELTELTETRFLDSKNCDISYIPLNVLSLKSRNSYPPGRDMSPLHHIQRSLSESNLCVKITASPSPPFKFSSSISISPSILVVDISERQKKPFRRTRPTSTLWENTNIEFFDENSSHPPFPNVIGDKLEAWETGYIQHWLRLDDTRTAIQQHRDFFELDYDKTELEDWSLSLSNDDMRDIWKKIELTTPGQFSISALPSIQENNALELEDSNEYLWNNSGYMLDKECRELVTFLMDTSNTQSGLSWPYALTTNLNLLSSPDNSWSSGGSDCYSYERDTFSKRSSAALSGCSDDTGNIPAIGTDFTRDFYRLVKFESTKSLASTSSRSVHGDNADCEMTLQNVFTILTEQKECIYSPEGNYRSCSDDELVIRESIETLATNENREIFVYNENGSKDENSVTVKQFCEETSLKEQNTSLEESMGTELEQDIAHENEVCLVKAVEVESENSNISDLPVDIFSMNVELPSDLKNWGDVRNESYFETNIDLEIYESLGNELTRSSDTSSSDISLNNGSESLTLSVNTPDTIVSKIPRRKVTLTKTPVSLSVSIHKNNKTKIPKMKLLNKSNSKSSPQKQKNINVQQQSANEVIPEEQNELSHSTSEPSTNIIVGCPSFHEIASSKDIIDELNRMIKNGEENVIVQEQVDFLVNATLDKGCTPTGWLHVERDIDLTDPKARANLLDVMMASVSSDSSPTSSCGRSIASDTTEEPSDYGHLHKIHRSHRQKKAKANRLEMAVVRASQCVPRPTIIGRTDIFVRYGDKEREAVASFDFLDNLHGSSSGFSVEDQLDDGVKGNGGSCHLK